MNGLLASNKTVENSDKAINLSKIYSRKTFNTQHTKTTSVEIVNFNSAN